MPRGERGTARPYLRGAVWWIKYYIPGDPVPKRESSESRNKADAVRLLNQRRKEVDDRKASSSNALIGDLLKLYLADLKRNNRANYKSAEGYVRLHLKPAFGSIKASAITSRMVNSFVEMKQIAGYKNASINRYLEGLRRAYTLGMESLPPLVYVAPPIEKLQEDNVREGFLEHGQYILMRDELPAHQQLLLVVGYHLGMRRGEILKLRWDQVDWDASLIRLEKKQTKGKKARVAPLYGELRAWFELAYEARDKDVPFIVTYHGRGIKEVKTAWKSARIRAGIPALLVHDLRRTAVRNMVRAGIPEKRAMQISGHRTRSMFDRYDITDESDIQRDGERLAVYLEEKAQKSKVGTRLGTVEDANFSDSVSIQ